MNYLAHLYLADADHESLIGNLMGDFVKGPVPTELPCKRRLGVILHRKIDTFTDAHPTFITSKRRIGPPFGRYSGILIDLVYDHFLARHWSHYSDQALPDFCSTVYTALDDAYPTLPARMQRSVRYMLANDLLFSYRELAGIERALQGIERRLRRPSGLSLALIELETHYLALETDFSEFFPQLIAFVEQKKQTLAQHETTLS